MTRNGYRDGLAQVNVVLDPELRDRMRRKARRNGRSMSEEFRLAALEWLGEEVEDHADGGARPRAGLAAVPDQRGPRPVPRADGSGAPRVGAGDGGQPRVDAADEWLAAVAPDRPVAEPAVDVALPFVDPIDEIA